MVRWSVDLIRNRAQHLGVVKAANDKEAIKAAIEETLLDTDLPTVSAKY